MSIKTKIISVLSMIVTAFSAFSVSANAAAEKNFATGDNSMILILAIVGIGVAALVIVLLTLLGNKKNKK